VTAEKENEWEAAVVDLLDRVKMCQPDELTAEVNAAVRPLGLDLTVYLVDLEQDRLWAVPEAGRPTPPPIPVDGSLAGRTFSVVETGRARNDQGTFRIWVPMVDGSERLGVVDVVAARPPDDEAAFRRRCEMLVGLLGHLVTVKMPYGDALRRARRTRPMAPSGELILAQLPPLTFSSRRMAVSAILEPCYDVGGDAFDYALDGPVARLAVLDAMGRGLPAALTSCAALAAIRAARRDGQDLGATARAADRAVDGQFPQLRFVTAVLAELNLQTGLLRYLNAGHPPPIVLRSGHAVRTLSGGRRLPLGLNDTSVEVGEEMLEPGDRLLLYTDGVTEAQDAAGERFGLRRLTDLAERCMSAGLPAPETLRRLSHEVRARQGGEPSDDATLLLLEWSAEAARRTQP